MLYSTRFLRIMDPFMTGPDVKAVQEQLAKLGYYKEEINGVYNKATEQAVINFQKAVGLTADGVVGPDTWNALGLGVPTEPLPINREYRINIDTQRFRLDLFRKGVLQASWPIAVGKPSTPTPIGDWIIIGKVKDPGGPFGVRWMRLNVPWGGYGIHGTDNPGSIGKAASHGCVRMLNEDVIKLYDIVPLGTPVKITGKAFTGRILRIGVDPGPDVLEVQDRLQILGFYKDELDGYYGPQTRKAVIAFQRSQGLVPDGVVGSNTYEALEKAHDKALGIRYP